MSSALPRTSSTDIRPRCGPSPRALGRSSGANCRGGEENGYPGWRLIGYRHEGTYLGFVAPLKDHVRLGFERGVHMNDPDGVLEGEGSRVRYVRLSSEDLPEEAIARLLKDAVSLSKLPLTMLPVKKTPAARRK